MGTKLQRQTSVLSHWRLGLVALGLSQLMGCAAKPENAPSGACTLSCGNARVGAAEFSVKRLNVSPLNLRCTAGQPLTAPVTVRYRVTQPVGPNFQGTQANAGAAAGADQAAANAAEVATIPVASLGFDPVVYGDMAFSKTAEEFKNSNNEVNPVRYAGVVTPPSEWCSDSCGVMTFEIWPNCVDQGEVKAAVQVGGAQVPVGEWTQITLKI